MTANEIDQPIEAEPPRRPCPTWDAGAPLVLLNGVIAAIAAIADAYTATRSVVATAIAGAAAVLVALLVGGLIGVLIGGRR
ncbi:hypothetical protein SAMN04489712_12149 [Thermomonospora echinospora]|uniref:Uncharacterized protein n=1 Tax=Thermomonospora echinospora TaxID=1992 RepID=A0A1H6DTQ4_9ACTN|nr:hypothetical protein [Thermomonospora echinospora]SEG87975.1 hypothetical protein SAMN04489712_12149 [Thermomonospora echinospora]